jgi:hypothetical protein
MQFPKQSRKFLEGERNMKKLLLLGIPLFAGAMLHAQADPPNPVNTSYIGTMENGGCIFQRNQQSYIHNGYINTSLVTNTNCPIQQMHSEIGVVAPNGKFVPIAPVANRQMIYHVRKHHRTQTVVARNQPVNVRVMATPDGSVVMRPLR